MYIFIFHIVNQYDTKSDVFRHDYKCDIEFIQQFNKQEVNIKRLMFVLDIILPVFAVFRQQK